MTDKEPKRPRDPNQLAKLIVDIATGEESEAQVENKPDQLSPGRAGGMKGGKARAESLTASERSKIAKKAAEARWKKANSDPA